MILKFWQLMILNFKVKAPNIIFLNSIDDDDDGFL